MAIIDENDTRASRIVLHDKKSEDQPLPVPGTSAAGVVAGGDGHENESTSECS